jgi:hypothetical protein
MNVRTLLAVFTVFVVVALCYSGDQSVTPKQAFVMRPTVLTNESGVILTAVYIEGFTNKATTIPALTNLLASLPQGSSLRYKPFHSAINFRLGTNRFRRYKILEDLCASNHVHLEEILVPDF